jgi:phosphatidylglycerol:prolipoprotein diacylglycerol transferase
MFEVGPFALRYYGLCIALGIIVATWLTGRELERKGYDGSLALDSLFFIVPLGFIGARAYHVITDYGLYSDDPFPGVFEVWNGGLGIYGGVVGGFVGLLIFARIRGISPWVFADAGAPGLVLAQAIGRWGNYFNQELFGRLSPDLPIRVDLGRPSLPDAALGCPPLRGPSEERRCLPALREPLLFRTLLC